MNDSENICLACGICCDGTLIGFVEVKAEEFSRLRGVLEIEKSDDIGIFLHPCEKFCDKCTIYSQRPKQCSLYECNLLKSYEKQEIDFKSATEIIQLVQEKKLAIEEKLSALKLELKSGSFYFKMVEAIKLLENKHAKTPPLNSHTELMIDIKELDNLVLKNFGVSYF